MFQLYARRPAEATEIERAAMLRLVVQGGGVTEAAVRAGLPRAEALLFCARGGQVLGVAALKVPQPGYRAGLAGTAKADVPLPEADYPRELGYLAVDEAARRLGLGRLLCSAAITLARGRGLFATTGQDAMRNHILPRLGFAPAGRIWQGREEPLSLMLRPGGPRV